MRWMPIRGFRRKYEVSDSGLVRNRETGLVLKTWLVRGYPAIRMYDGLRRRSALVHRLVAQAFLVNASKRRVVNHKNGRRTDNRVSNLEWVSYAENNRHAERTGAWNHRGENHSNARLTETAVRQILRCLAAGQSQTKVGRSFGVSQSTVWTIASGRRWKHVTREGS